MQQKLLKALDEKTFFPVGSSTPVKCEFTLISATCEDIQEKIIKKEFREDLFFRLSGFNLHLKSLAQRSGDIDLLIKHFQKKSSRRFVIKPEAMEALKKYGWPGNIRELSKTCERFAQNLSGIVDLPLVKKTISPPSTGSLPGLESLDEYIQNHGLRTLISQVEKKAVEDALKRNNGKITACIKELKISSSAFYRILQENQLQF
jgi:DNA-binding NtrC family response regulator